MKLNLHRRLRTLDLNTLVLKVDYDISRIWITIFCIVTSAELSTLGINIVNCISNIYLHVQAHICDVIISFEICLTARLVSFFYPVPVSNNPWVQTEPVLTFYATVAYQGQTGCKC